MSSPWTIPGRTTTGSRRISRKIWIWRTSRAGIGSPNCKRASFYKTTPPASLRPRTPNVFSGRSHLIGICLWHRDGQILEANDAFLHLVGYGRGDLVAGRVRWRDITPDVWHAADAQALA